MDDHLSATAVSPLRQRLIDDMTLRRFVLRGLSYASRRPRLSTVAV